MCLPVPCLLYLNKTDFLGSFAFRVKFWDLKVRNVGEF